MITKHDSWKREEDLENVKEIIVEFKERVNTKVKKTRKVGYSRREEL